MLYKLEKDNKLEKLSDADVHNVLGEIERVLDDYNYDHYRYYPSKNKKGWKQLFIESLKGDLKKDDFVFIYANEKDIPVISTLRYYSTTACLRYRRSDLIDHPAFNPRRI